MTNEDKIITDKEQPKEPVRFVDKEPVESVFDRNFEHSSFYPREYERDFNV